MSKFWSDVHRHINEQDANCEDDGGEVMSDIVKSLRQASLNQGDYRWKAADEIERLKDGEARLRAALEGAAVQFANNNLPAFSHQCRAALKEKERAE